MIQHIDVHSVLQESSAGVYTDLVTRPTGRVVRERIHRVIASARGAASITRMDFNGVGCMDYSCADEIVARLVRDGLRSSCCGISLTGTGRRSRGCSWGTVSRSWSSSPTGRWMPSAPAAAAIELVEQLVAQRLARRLPEARSRSSPREPT